MGPQAAWRLGRLAAMGDDRRRHGELVVVAGAGAGAAAGLALPPLGWLPLLWPALAVLWGLVGSPPSAGRAAAAGAFAWGLAAVLVSHRWLLWLHPLDWIGVPAPLSLPVCLLLWLLVGSCGGALVLLWLLVLRRLDPARPESALLGAALWGLAEVWLARGPLFWIGLGSAPLPGDRSLAGVAALGGAGLVAALQLAIGWALLRAVAAPPRRRSALALALLLAVAGHLGGAAALAAAEGEGGPRERLLVVQPAIPTREKFSAHSQSQLLRQLERAQASLAGQVGEVGAAGAPGGGPGSAPPAAVQSLLLPEGALATGQRLPGPAPVEVLSGGFRQQGEGLRSSLLRFPEGASVPAGWIDKHRVVPLGEWVPLAGLLRWSGLSAVGGVEPGAASRLLPRPAGAVGVAICYELADGASLAEASRAGARWLLASANLDPYPALLQGQFAALARLRAIESGRWLVSAANTGPSLVVDASGRLRQQLPPSRSTSGVMTLEQRSGLTPYVRWGERPLIVLALLGGGLRLRSARRG
ncbi:MAG: apolipoprotein N-acyltransferase [Synechococcaceae cyanobacterium]|nr:apolipoprotein N-acyltransferase [Synechococcaceae cyanobacterium]